MQNHRRRETPPLRSVKRIGLLFTAESPLEYGWSTHPCISGQRRPIPAGDGLESCPVTTPFFLVSRRISEKPISAARSRGDSSVRWWPMWRYLPRRAGSQFRPDTFPAATRPGHFEKELPVVAVASTINRAASITSRFSGRPPRHGRASARNPAHGFPAFRPPRWGKIDITECAQPVRFMMRVKVPVAVSSTPLRKPIRRRAVRPAAE